jgi:hypothetical protein
MARRGGYTRRDTGADHAALQFGDFRECRLDRIFDRPNLGGDFKGGGFDHLFAHDMILPRRETFATPAPVRTSNLENERAA